MSKDYLYPDIPPQSFKMIDLMRRLMKDHQDYLDDSPYSDETQRYLRSWFDKPLNPLGEEAAPVGNPREELLTGEDRYEQLYKETVTLFAGLMGAKPGAGDTAETMTYYRTATGLLDKLLNHQERSLSIKKVHEFHTVVLDIMENVLSPDQRNDAITRLKTAIKEG